MDPVDRVWLFPFEPVAETKFSIEEPVVCFPIRKFNISNAVPCFRDI